MDFYPGETMMTFDLAVNQPVVTQQVQKFESCQGARIFQLPLEAFPGFWVYAYLVLVDNFQVLIDAGSGFGVSNDHLEERLRQVAGQVEVETGLPQLTHVLITHGHIDHFGGLSYIHAHSSAQIGVHELDLRNLTNTEERLAIVSRRLDGFLAEAGIRPDRRLELIELYRMTKLDYVPVPVDFTFNAVGMHLGPFEMLHVPGHCAGQVVIRLHDVLFSGDHVLSEISPHQAPERLVLNTGLGHYLDSLEALREWAVGIRLTLGGHNQPIEHLSSRIDEIQLVHKGRLTHILDILKTPQTISEVSHILFNQVHGYNVLLALEETGAHVEYLYQHGLLTISNLDELESSNGPLPIRYQALDYSIN
jgi:glyoxylase-like metal-dependent hydrolase (beta-lactamase superfamily II)